MSSNETATSRTRACFAFNDEYWQLLPQRGLYRPRTGSLIIADTHFGKAATFRAAGSLIPAGTTRRDLDRLDAMIDACATKCLIILGDFFHAASGCCTSTLSQLHDWRARHAELQIDLVLGNHDQHAGAPPADWGFRVHRETLVEAGVVHQHKPGEDARGYVLAGHVHPAVRIDHRGRAARWAGGRAAGRLPCFHFGSRCGVLPAFGSFTGTKAIRAERDDRVFAVLDDGVFEIGGT